MHYTPNKQSNITKYCLVSFTTHNNSCDYKPLKLFDDYVDLIIMDIANQFTYIIYTLDSNQDFEYSENIL